MGELKMDEMFEQFEAEMTGTFRPVPLNQMATRARRRSRLRRGWFAGVLAALLAGPAGVFAVASQGDGRPSPAPSPSVTSTPSPDFHPVERKITVPGVADPVIGLVFTDARHGWALFGSCSDENTVNEVCGRLAMASTEDGGATWKRANLPGGVAEDDEVSLYALDSGTAVVHVWRKRFWLTTDGGANFTQHSISSPPAEVLKAANLDEGRDFSLRCAGQKGLEDSWSVDPCEREEVVRTGVGPVKNQPPFAADVLQLVQGADGRLWVLDQEDARTRVAFSTDGGDTWREVPPVPTSSLTSTTSLTVSPDGIDVWLVSESERRLWRFSGSEFVAQPQEGLPDFALSNVRALGNGLLVMISGTEGPGPVGYWRDGRLTPVDGLQATWGQTLRDGTLYFTGPSHTTVALGVGSGMDRNWIRLS